MCMLLDPRLATIVWDSIIVKHKVPLEASIPVSLACRPLSDGTIAGRPVFRSCLFPQAPAPFTSRIVGIGGISPFFRNVRCFRRKGIS